MGIYNSRGFNWKQYEEIPEKTNFETYMKQQLGK